MSISEDEMSEVAKVILNAGNNGTVVDWLDTSSKEPMREGAPHLAPEGNELKGAGESEDVVLTSRGAIEVG